MNCSKCNILIPPNEIKKKSRRCLACRREDGRLETQRNKERLEKYRKENAEKIRQQQREHYLVNREENIKKVKEWYLKNLERKREYDRDYRKKNREKLNRGRRENRKNNLNTKLRMNLAGRIAKVLRGVNKSKSTMQLVGCSIEFLKSYLESKFLPGMTWDNYGFWGWHVDHIIPCVSFDLKDPEQQKKCFHYTNLQPLWGVENMKKGGRISPATP